ncbi:MAG: energy-coupling factor transporter ATPase [Oscillospiraceae bacterium]|nr:energy-coupling factor transporter ATPase [Oscillospiraceae bacterium]
MTPFIEVKNLTHKYSAGTPFEHTALDDVSFSLERGEFIGVIGHTGSGKSTLMQHLNGLLKPDSGEILLDGVDIWQDKKTTRQTRFRVGLVFQYPEYQLFEETVYKDIAFGPKNMGLKADEIDRRVKESAAAVGLSDEQLTVSPFDLSGGQKRRVAIAGVLAMEPELLILDEPTAGLDPAGREEILNYIDSYRKAKHATIMMVSHSMGDVARMADRLIVMNKSKIALMDTPAEVFRHADELVQMGLNIPVLTQVFMKLKQLGLPVEPVYTQAQAVKALTALKGGNADA